MTVARNRRVLLLALLLAAISAALAYRALATRLDSAPVTVAAAPIAGEPVLIAARSIAAGHTITAADVEIAYVPAEAKGERALTEAEQAIGEVALVAMPKGEQVLAGSVGPSLAADPETFAKDVPLGMRAVTIASEETIGVGGFVQPGDRVDVIAAMELKPVRPPQTLLESLGDLESGGDPFPMAELIVQDVEVLAIGQALDPAAPTAPPEGDAAKEPSDGQKGPAARPEAASVTLLVDPAQALRLTLSTEAEATFRLLLRAPGDTTVTELPPALITNGDMAMEPFKMVGGNLASEKDLVIISARFQETSVPAGGILHFEATVRNVSSQLIPAGRGGAAPGHVYEAGETWQSLAEAAPAGVFSVGVTADHAQDQSYQWRWDLGKDLAPGATATITGGIQVPQTPGVQRWWFGTVLQPGTILEDGVAPVAITIEPVSSVVVTADKIALRASPWPDAAGVLTVVRGAQADVLDYEDGWFQVRASGKDGWVPESAVQNSALPGAKMLALVYEWMGRGPR